MEFNPSLKIKLLSSIDPGSLVLIADSYGFCAVSAGDPAKQHAVIRYDGAAFQYEGGTGPLVDFGKGYTISPDLATFEPNAAPEPNGTLYFLDGSPALLLSVGTSIGFVNLSTGLMSTPSSWPILSGFRSWRAGVAIDGELVPLIEVVPDGATFGEGDAFEPEQH